MDPRFQEYGQSVCRFVRHAAGSEKAAITRELTAHLEDHAQALLDVGYSAEDAAQMALEAMGDPQEVGKELNKEYPLRWLLLSNLGAVLVTLLTLAILVLAPTWLFHLEENLSNRFWPMDHIAAEQVPGLVEVDVRKDLPGGNVFYIYGVSAVPEGDAYTVRVCSVFYNKNLFRDYSNLIGVSVTLSAPGVSQECYFGEDVYVLPGVSFGQPVTLRYDHYGTTFTLEIPVPWEEAAE